MDFSKLYVDTYFLKSLEKIGFNEGWISESENPVLRINYLKSKTLLYLTLFDQIDSPSVYLIDTDCARFIDAGILTKKSRLFNEKRSVFESEAGKGSNSNQFQRIKTIKETARLMLLRDKFTIIDDLYVKVKVGRDKELPEDVIKYSDIVKQYDFLLDANDTEADRLSPEFQDMKEEIERNRYTLEELLYLSVSCQNPFVTAFSHSLNQQASSQLKLVEDAIYVARTRLTDEVLYLPDPHNLDDVERMRAHPSIERFRRVVGEWAMCLQHGQGSFEEKARRDIRLANRDLKSLNKWRQYSSSPLNFWINSIGGHIPYLSNILTAIFMVGGILEKRVEKKSGWIMIGKS